jgi:hypothetical protein
MKDRRKSASIDYRWRSMPGVCKAQAIRAFTPVFPYRDSTGAPLAHIRIVSPTALI